MKRGRIAALSVVLLSSTAPLAAQQAGAPGVAIGDRDLGGVVRSPNGPEAGVWVIAETSDLPTGFAKMVVTDDQGRYVLPDLPKANYRVWVRGYGLIDSPKVESAPGKIVNLTAVVAPSEAAAAQYYPAIYWMAMLKIPAKNEFPAVPGSGMPASYKIQEQWVAGVKTDGCVNCHQLGDEATRTIPKNLGTFSTAAEAWTRRIQSGQAGIDMVDRIGKLDTPRALRLFGDWTDRVAAGELPFEKPSRPQGIERNLVISVWDWGGPHTYIHDEIASDKRDPTVNANGPIYGTPNLSSDFAPVLDPVNNVASEIQLPYRDANGVPASPKPLQASPYWGDEQIWSSRTLSHNPMFDSKGRVWFTTSIHGKQTAAFCRKGSDHPSAQLFPIERAGRQLAVYDPKTSKFTTVDTCFSTHHLQFDDNDRIGRSSGCRRHRFRRRDGMVRREGVRCDRRRSEGAGLDPDHPRHQRQRQTRRGLCRAEASARSEQGQAHPGRLLRHRAEQA